MIEPYYDIVCNLLSEISKESRPKIAIIYHGDGDGVISAAIFAEILIRTRSDAKIHFHCVRTEEFDFLSALSKIGDVNPDWTLFLDLSIQQYPHHVMSAVRETRKRVFIYDHHKKSHKELDVNSVTYLNPLELETGTSDVPPCMFAAQVYNRLFGDDLDWLVGIGLITESLVKHNINLFGRLFEQYPNLFRIKPTCIEDLDQTDYQRTAYCVNSAFWSIPGQYEEKTLHLIRDALRSSSPKKLLEFMNNIARELLDNNNRVSEEIDKFAQLVATHAILIDSTTLRFSEITSKYRIGGVVAGRVARHYPESIIVISQIYNDRYVIEIRRGSNNNEDIASFLGLVLASLSPINVGGHAYAAGGSICKEQRLEFFNSLRATSLSRLARTKSTQSYNWGPKTNCFPQEIQIAYINSIQWLRRKQKSDGSWGREDHVLSKIIATHHVLMTLQAVGFGSGDKISRKAYAWLINLSKEDHHHFFWRLSALLSFPDYSTSMRDHDMQALLACIDEKAAPSSKLVMELYPLRFPESDESLFPLARKYLNSAKAELKRRFEEGKLLPSIASQGVTAIEKYPAANCAHQLYELREFVKKSVVDTDNLCHWQSSIIQSSYILINIAESTDFRKDPEISEIATKCIAWLNSKRERDGSWKEEPPAYDGGSEVTSSEYTTAVALRALLAMQGEAGKNLLYGYPDLILRVYQDNVKRVLYGLFLTIMLLGAGIIFVPLVAKNFDIANTILGFVGTVIGITLFFNDYVRRYARKLLQNIVPRKN